MNAVAVEALVQTPVEDQLIELVERKGLGHPDSICDGIADYASRALCREYRNLFGRVLHHNLDKIMIIAGESLPRINGGTILKPLRLILGDRATSFHQSKVVDVEDIVIGAAKEWLRNNLQYVDPDRHVIFQNEIKAGSPELVDLFERKKMGANDTSAAVGFAPFTKTEGVVLSVEEYLNSPQFKLLFPETGEDVKVMALRQGRNLHLTIAIAFVGHLVSSREFYFHRKNEIHTALIQFLAPWDNYFESIKIEINALDDQCRGEKGMYLTVLGISADGADSGQVGRGNRANGLISLNRPQSIEAHAGKNPLNHVGKIYSHFANYVASKIYSEVNGIREVYVYLCSQIGRPIDQPLIASAKLILNSGFELHKVREAVDKILNQELAQINQFSSNLK